MESTGTPLVEESRISPGISKVVDATDQTAGTPPSAHS